MRIIIMGFRDFWRRRRIWARDLPDSPENWSDGDDALAIGAESWATLDTLEPMAGPDKGEVNRVKAVHLCDGVQFLEFASYVGAYASHNFQKLPPRQEESFDFRKLLKHRTRYLEEVE